MNAWLPSRAVAASFVLLSLTTGAAGARDPMSTGVGTITSIQGIVTLTHPGHATPVPAALRSDVVFRDIIETQRASRTKALFQDDSLLTVGENSRVEISEHIFDPDRQQRSVVVDLIKGRLRALVGKAFSGAGSRFEVHTPTAVAAARGTSFVVWIDQDGTNGVANIGDHGHVDFSSGGKTVHLNPHQFSVAVEGGKPNTPETLSVESPGMVTTAVVETELGDPPMQETAERVLSATGGVQVGPVVPTGMVLFQAGSVPVTPPGVVSGATGNRVTGTKSISLSNTINVGPVTGTGVTAGGGHNGVGIGIGTNPSGVGGVNPSGGHSSGQGGGGHGPPIVTVAPVVPPPKAPSGHP